MEKMLAVQQSDGSPLIGTFRGKDAGLRYDPNTDGGILIVQGSVWKEVICNRNIIAVVDNQKAGGNNNEGVQRILYMPDVPESEYRFENIDTTNLPQSFVEANLISPHIAKLSFPKVEALIPYLYVIISTGSGAGEAQQYFDNVLKPALSAIGIHDDHYYVHTTSSNQSISDLASKVLLPRANQGHPQTILLLSGDGGVVDIVNHLLSSSRTAGYVKPAIGLIAMGTGNAFANSTGLNRDQTKGLRHFFQGKAHSVPTFSVLFSAGSEYLVNEGRKTEPLASLKSGVGVVYGAVVCSWALHASLVADSDTLEYRKFGHQRFQMAAKELLTPSDGSASHAYQGKITLFKKDPQGEEIAQTLDAREHMYVLATLVSNLEEKFNISPHSKPLDGQLRLLQFGVVPTADVMKILGLAFQGGAHVEDDSVRYESIEGMRIDFDETVGRWRRVCVDGKIIRVNEGGWMEVRRNTSDDVLDVIADLGV